ncbi:MAG: tetratricopeptide repeat protein [Candidatus Anammoxibacter sp.]
MSFILDALKRARKERVEKTGKDKGFKIASILSPIDDIKKKVVLSKNMRRVLIRVVLAAIIILPTYFFFSRKKTTIRQTDSLRESLRRGAILNASRHEEDSPVVPAQTDKGQAVKPQPLQNVGIPKALPVEKTDPAFGLVPDANLRKIDEKNEVAVSAPLETSPPKVETIVPEPAKAETVIEETKTIPKELKAESAGQRETVSINEPPKTNAFPLIKDIPKKVVVEEKAESTTLPSSIYKYEPGPSIYHYNLGVLYQKEGQLDRAIHEYENVVSIDPLNPEVYNNLGTVYKDKGLLDIAIEKYKKALSLNPEYRNAQYNLVVTRFLKNEFAGAASDAKVLISLDPKNMEIYNILSMCYKKLGRNYEAMEVLVNAMSIDSAHPQTHYNQALLLEEEGNINDAVLHYKMFLALSKSAKNRALAEKVRNHLQQIVPVIKTPQ